MRGQLRSPLPHRVRVGGPCPQVSAQAEACASVYRSRGFVFPEAFVGFHVMGTRCTVDSLCASIAAAAAAGASVCEVCWGASTACTLCVSVCMCLCVCVRAVVAVQVMVHPGHRVTGAGGCGTGPDEFSVSPDREHELRTVTGVLSVVRPWRLLTRLSPCVCACVCHSSHSPCACLCGSSTACCARCVLQTRG